MAATRNISELAETVLNESGLVLGVDVNTRVRQLGNSSCKTGIEATLTYFSENPELLNDESAKKTPETIPEDYKKKYFDKHLERLHGQLDIKLEEQQKKFCFEAFESGVSAALLYLLRAAKAEKPPSIN